jgi:hypothetical protein
MKPAGGHSEQTALREILRQAHILVGEAVAAMQEQNGREWAGTGRVRHGCHHDAHTRHRYLYPLHRKGFGAGWHASDRDCR